MHIVILGLSITSSWGNGHATTYRALMRQLVARGHNVLFLERDVPWYAAHRDLPRPPYGRTELYRSVDELQSSFSGAVREADVVIVGSFVPEGVAVGQWALEEASAVAFYDIDTPVTLAKLSKSDYEYITPDLVGRYHLYLSFTGGRILRRLERQYGSPMARPLYCSVDAELYAPLAMTKRWHMGYLGTYSHDRQPTLSRLLTATAKLWPEGRFVVAGPQYPAELDWPANVERIEHLSPDRHAAFYCSQRLTLNVTRGDMIKAGYCPSVRLFEAAACGTPIVSDSWPGLSSFFEPGKEILLADSAEQVLEILRKDYREVVNIGLRARERVLSSHTAVVRAQQLEVYLQEMLQSLGKASAMPST